MVLADLVRAALVGLLAVAIAQDLASLGMVVLMVFAVGVAGCFFDPASQAAIPALVGRDPEALARANSKLWSLDLVGRSLVGPPLGAALFAIAAVWPFAGNALTFAISAALLAGLEVLDRRPVSREAAPKVRHSVREGVSFLWRQRELRALTLGMTTFNLTYNVAFAPLVLFAQDHLGLRDRGFGLLLAMLAIGGLVGAWLAPHLQRRIRSVDAYAIGLGIQAAAWLTLWLWPYRWVAGMSMAAIGVASMLVTVIGAAARQQLTPDALLGRVGAGTRTVGLGAAGVGALCGGAAGTIAGLGAPLLLAVVLAGTGIVALARPHRVRR
jgi:Na+/melibiose symporter-like transporter